MPNADTFLVINPCTAVDPNPVPVPVLISLPLINEIDANLHLSFPLRERVLELTKAYDKAVIPVLSKDPGPCADGARTRIQDVLSAAWNVQQPPVFQGHRWVLNKWQSTAGSPNAFGFAFSPTHNGSVVFANCKVNEIAAYVRVLVVVQSQ